MRAVPPLPDPGAAPDLLAELYGELSAVYGRLAAEMSRRSTVQTTPAHEPGEDGPPLDSKSAAKLIGRSEDWFGRHRAEFATALVSKKGQRPRYSRRLLERCLARNNRSQTRTD